MVGSAFAFIDPDWESERIREHFQQRGHPELTEAFKKTATASRNDHLPDRPTQALRSGIHAKRRVSKSEHFRPTEISRSASSASPLYFHFPYYARMALVLYAKEVFAFMKRGHWFVLAGTAWLSNLSQSFGSDLEGLGPLGYSEDFDFLSILLLSLSFGASAESA